MLRRLVRGLGKVLLGLGVLVGLFVAYQLWGTGIAERRGQRDLAARFEQRRAAAPPVVVGAGAPVAPATTLPAVELGDSVALLEIPSIDVKKWVVEGVEVEDLKSGPGHYPGTSMPGARGNAAIAGHRTTYGAPFYDLNELRPGDPIFLTTDAGRFRYDVTGTVIVDPVEGAWVLDQTSDDRLTLTTCNPRLSAAERLIVTARRMSPPSDAPASPPAMAPGPGLAGPESGPTLSGERASTVPAYLWGGVVVAIWLAAWSGGRAWRRWPAYAVAAGPLLVALLMFYDYVARLLPANV